MSGAAKGRLVRLAGGPLLPLALLVAQLGVVYVQRAGEHGWEPARLPDTKSYLQAARAGSFAEAVSHYRTYGYPLFLRLVGDSGLGLEAVPRVQFTLYSLAVVGFWAALRLFLGSAWLALAGATPLPWAYVVDLMPEIMTDSLAAALTLAVTSLALALAVRPGNRWLWAALVPAVFATYQVRPAAVFLIGWVPLVALVLRTAREGRLSWRIVRWAVGLGLATVLPWLAFCGARRVVVGHFGLVSFGGTNLAGVAASFLDEELVSELPPEHRGVAAGMLRIRERRFGWKPMTPEADTFDYFLQYSKNIWRVSLTAAQAQYKRERARRVAAGEAVPDRRPPRVVRNEMLSGVSKAIVRARPHLYLKWVRDSFLYGIESLARRPWVVWPAALALLSLLFHWLRRGRVAGGDKAAKRLTAAILFVGLSYFLLYNFLISLVSWPFPRYFSATILLLPSALCVVLADIWLRARPARAASAGTMGRR